MAPYSSVSPYFYDPEISITFVGAVIFAFVAVAHSWLFFRCRTWFFWAMPIGALMETVGFIARAVSIRNVTGQSFFLISYSTILLAPTFLAAACYAIFGRMIWWVVPPEQRTFRTLWITPRVLTFMFAAFNLGSFLIQLIGACAIGAAYANTGDMRSVTGHSILSLGLTLQIVSFAAFCVLNTRLVLASRQWVGIPLRYGAPHIKWMQLNRAISFSALLLLIRAVYRLLEFTGDGSIFNYAQSHEWPFWTFDALPMLCVLVTLLVYHPLRYLPSELLGHTLDRKRLQKVEQSSPPSYDQSEAFAMQQC